MWKNVRDEFYVNKFYDQRSGLEATILWIFFSD